jgi:plasmid stabilization system protein ParE
VTYRVVVTAKANIDAIRAFRWKAEHSAKVAERWYAGLEKAIASLSKFPERHPVAEDESERLGITLRLMVYGRKPGTYRLLFSIEGDTVVLHYIRHGARGLIDDEEEP